MAFVCLLVEIMPLLAGQVSFGVHCLSAGQAAGWYKGHQAFFLPYIATSGRVVSPVAAGGQQHGSLLTTLPHLKPEHKCQDHMG